MQTTNTPLVSVVIPTYNHRRYICDAVDSALGQTYPHCEVIVVDDGSTDGTGDLLRQRYGDRIRIIYQENRGLPAARNAGTWQARGVYVNYCDSDDQLLPEKVARCVAVFAQHPEAGVVYTDFERVVDDGETIIARPHPLLPSGDIFCELLLGRQGNFIMEAAPLVRRALLVELGGFDERLHAAEDWHMWLRLSAEAPFIYLAERLALYRVRPGAMHTDPIRMARARLKMYELIGDVPRRVDCIDDAAYARVLAGRHHVLGLVYWRAGRRAEAREAFHAAIRLEPYRSVVRRLYVLLSYVFPARAATMLQRARSWLHLERR